MKRKVVFLDRGTVPPHVKFPSLGEGYEWMEYNHTPDELIAERLEGAAVCVVNKLPLMAATLKQVPELKLIALTATGSNNIDLGYCGEANIAVSNVVAYGSASIAEHVFAMILALRRNLMAYREAAFTKWSESSFFTVWGHPIHELSGSTLGVLGKGTLGLATGKLGEAFGMKVLYAERKGRSSIRAGYTDFTETLRRADVLTIHTPLTAETEQLISGEELARMKPTAILINTARGGVVDELALVEALRNKTLGGAGIDVTRPEPPHPDNPLFALRLFHNVILTPHIAWGGANSLKVLSAQVIENIQAFFNGEEKRRLV